MPDREPAKPSTPAKSSKVALPRLDPMLATSGGLPASGSAGEGWAYEMKWDGVRAVARVDGVAGTVELAARSGRDVTTHYPELAALATTEPRGGGLAGRRAVLDGEIVAFDDEGRVSFSALQPRIHGLGTSLRPVAYLVFDLLYLDGESLVREAYDRRRPRLESLALAGPNWQTPPVFPAGTPGQLALDAATAQGLEGLMAKRRDSIYQPGQRSHDWIKVKIVRTQEVVIGGWRTGRDSRASTFGSLLCGVYDDDGVLRYVGRVGSGFSGAVLQALHARLSELARDGSPLADVPAADVRDAHWVEPELVGEVTYATWTPDGRLWHPRWRGLRTDKDPREVVRES